MKAKAVLDELVRAGMAGGILPIERLDDLRADVVSLYDSGIIDADLYDTYLRPWRFLPPEDLPDARSMVVVATPVPKVIAHFTWQGQDVPVVVPPTYSDAAEVTKEVKEALVRGTAPTEAKFSRAFLPLKTMAARCGVVKYGRNNITYAPGCGSYHRLTAFFTDLDLGTDMWREREALPRCEKCRACVRACPGSAITEDRFTIHAEKCLTYLNEMPSEVPFPSYVGAEWHNAIIGCMRCQDVCPEDRTVRDRVVEGGRFSEEDTRYLLDGDFQGPRADEMGRRLEPLGLELLTFPRNLKVLLRDR